MGFYQPSTIVKDAQRHGLRVKPIDIMVSDWKCTLEAPEQQASTPSLRMGLRYAKGLREEAAQAIVRERGVRPFESVADLAHRVPELSRNELVLLASIGALNAIGGADAGRDCWRNCRLDREENRACTAGMRCGRWNARRDRQGRCWMGFRRAIRPRRWRK